MNLLQLVIQAKVFKEQSTNDWERQDAATMVVISGTLSEEMLYLTVDCMSAKELWATIEDFFKDLLKKLKIQTLEPDDYDDEEGNLQGWIDPTNEELNLSNSKLRAAECKESVFEELDTRDQLHESKETKKEPKTVDEHEVKLGDQKEPLSLDEVAIGLNHLGPMAGQNSKVQPVLSWSHKGCVPLNPSLDLSLIKCDHRGGSNKHLQVRKICQQLGEVLMICPVPKFSFDNWLIHGTVNYGKIVNVFESLLFAVKEGLQSGNARFLSDNKINKNSSLACDEMLGYRTEVFTFDLGEVKHNCQTSPCFITSAAHSDSLINDVSGDYKHNHDDESSTAKVLLQF